MHQLPLAILPSIVSGFGPVVTREQLRSAGVSGPILASAVRAGIIVRLRRAHYALPSVALDCATAVRLGGRLGSISAARSYGWWDGEDKRIHVSWPANGNIAKPGRVLLASPEDRTQIVHHWRILREPLLGEPQVWREPPEQTLAQVILSCDRLTAIATADSAIRSGTLAPFEVAAVFTAMPRRVQEWELHVDGRPDSGLESMVRVWLRDRRVPFVLHAPIAGVGEVDFLVGESLIIESDGRKGHDDLEGQRRDYRRDTAAAGRGYITVRLNYPQIMHDWPACERQILEHLGRGDHRRPIY